ncbi:thioredoxin family protein [Candidatus Bathyarchaeota archaeon]|nr:thioredoxin family protein [Candidatus Bathyarchaeota archaeon]MBS7631314.1 thioredoxin family protein [Candidatus Bathyarchaeota archaeon]
MKVLKVEVIGVNPPCIRCRQTEENAKKAAKKLEAEGIKVDVVKLDISSEETISKYGVLMSPAIAVNGVVKMMGKVLDPGVIERILRKEL